MMFFQFILNYRHSFIRHSKKNTHAPHIHNMKSVEEQGTWEIRENKDPTHKLTRIKIFCFCLKGSEERNNKQTNLNSTRLLKWRKENRTRISLQIQNKKQTKKMEGDVSIIFVFKKVVKRRTHKAQENFTFFQLKKDETWPPDSIITYFHWKEKNKHNFGDKYTEIVFRFFPELLFSWKRIDKIETIQRQFASTAKIRCDCFRFF